MGDEQKYTQIVTNRIFHFKNNILQYYKLESIIADVEESLIVDAVRLLSLVRRSLSIQEVVDPWPD